MLSFKLNLISMKTEGRCNFPDISYLSEMQINNFQFLNKCTLLAFIANNIVPYQEQSDQDS